jgi:hypothetical protein
MAISGCDFWRIPALVTLAALMEIQCAQIELSQIPTASFDRFEPTSNHLRKRAYG